MASLAIAAFLVALALPCFADGAAANAGSATAGSTNPPSILGPIGDVGFGSDGTIKDQDGYQARIGELYAPGGECYLIPILVPNTPAGQRIASVHLRFQLLGIASENGGPANADLYVIGLRDSNKPVASDYYQGAKPDPKATLLQAGFLTSSAKPRTDADGGPYVESSAAADAALAKYLEDAGTKPGGVAGKYVILRISYAVDTIPDGNNAYMLLTSGASGDNEKPQVAITFAPK